MFKLLTSLFNNRSKQQNKQRLFQLQPKITFRVDSFIENEIEGLVEFQNINRNSFFRAALQDFIRAYNEVGQERFEEHWYKKPMTRLTMRYTVTLSGTLLQKIETISASYRRNNIRFNKSLFVRCAVVDRILNVILEEQSNGI